MRVVAVDERDSSWEDPDPTYRVYLHGGSARDGEEWTGGTTWTYDVTEADLLQVVDWAQREAGGTRHYAIALVRDNRREDSSRGLVWLIGMDGNDSITDPPSLDRQRRMLVRMTDPVGIPEADRAPSPR
ncbi:hypothetical protein ABLE68_21600 [Nocardioides sp. CN2-186]|uniref:hypothetical protein n=1 Tax=Nocardioides tweenelious TaxID=3156607 RepID=UPI0032B5EFEF